MSNTLPNPVRKNWICTSAGDLVNLDHVAKIRLGTNIAPTPVALTVIINHAIGTGAGAVLKYVYATQAQADAEYAKIRECMLGLGMVSDLR